MGDSPLLEIHNAVGFGLDCVPPWRKDMLEFLIPNASECDFIRSLQR